jgi:cysteine sulfinate desulfinase/cysteine desulfurase-like protein
MGVWLAKGTFRISLGCENTVEDVDRITSAFI